ncbi:diacylglycerol/lipid kinase family protein [Corynebacterium sp. H130]|uniref:diacylglycerol/lipid kinase family protein n=1 Tax=Corynebacterium sp. H130 TaxID=3133444 RepID=UPI0030A29E46
MRVLVLSNPNSTSLNDEAFRQAVAPLRQVAHIHARHTQYRGHATEIVSGLTKKDVDAVIVIGGDGTVNEALSGLLGSHPSPDTKPMLGVIPTGSANVFARALGFPNDPAEAAAQLADLLKAGTYRRLPVGRVNDRWFCVNVGFGMDAEVIGRMDKLRDRGIPATPWHYSLVTFGAWRKLRMLEPSIHFEAVNRTGEVVTGDVPFVIVSNTNPWTYAGPVPLVTNPDHDIEDGCSLFALSDFSEIGGVRALGSLLINSLSDSAKNPLNAHETRVDDATAITLESNKPLKWQVDGEYAGETTSISIATVPAAVDVICPKSSTFK